MFQFHISNRKTDKLEELLLTLIMETTKMTTSLVQLDAILAELAPTVATVSTNVQALLDKVNAGQDFTAEATNLQSAIDGLNALNTSVNAANAPAPVTPTPVAPPAA